MFVYLSDLVKVGPLSHQSLEPRAFALITAAGGDGALFDLRDKALQGLVAGNCLVGSSVQIPSPPAGVSLLLDEAQLDAPLPTAVRTQINAQLAITLATGLTWRQALRALAVIHGVGRWGFVVPDADGHVRLHFGQAGTLDLG